MGFGRPAGPGATSFLRGTLGAVLTSDVVREISRGNIAGASYGFISGEVPAVDTGATPVDVWSVGTAYTGQPVGGIAETASVYSSSTDDAAGGTGARTVRLTGLDASWAPQTWEGALDGTTPVETVGVTWQRIWRLEVLTAGSGEANAGVVTCRHTTTAANVFCAAGVGLNQSQAAVYTVPAGCTLYILRAKVHMGRNNGNPGSARYSLRARPPGGVFNAVQYEILTTSIPDDYVNVGLGHDFSERTDVKFRVDVVSDNASTISVLAEYILVSNSL